MGLNRPSVGPRREPPGAWYLGRGCRTILAGGRAGRLIDEAGIAAGTSLTDAGLTVTLPPGGSRELVADINRRLVGAGISVYGLPEIRASLEDWFLSVTTRLGDNP